MKRYLIPILILLCAAPAWGAVFHAVPTAGVGDSTGSNWSNAMTLVKAETRCPRGDSIAVADGTYPEMVWDKIDSAGVKITVFKATHAGNHGSNVGWAESMGNGQAVCGGWTVTRGQFVFDGQGTTTVPDSTCAATGFKIDVNAVGIGVYLRSHDWGTSAAAPDSITIKYVEIDGHGLANLETDEYGIKTYPVVPSGETFKGITVSNCFIHDIDAATQTLVSEYWTIERNFITRNYTSDGHNAEFIADYGGDYFTIRYNILADGFSSGWIIPMHAHGASTTTIGWQIYGNLLYVSNGDPFETTASIVIGYDDPATPGYLYQDNKVFNNTFVNINTGLHNGIKFPANASSSGNEVYNNLWYNCGPLYMFNSIGTTFDYNTYMGSSFASATGYYSNESANDDSLAADPTIFTNYDAHDFSPAKEVSAREGVHLDSTTVAGYGYDLGGTIRGVDAFWTRGYLEFGTGSAPVYRDWYLKPSFAGTSTGTHTAPFKTWAALNDSLVTGGTVHVEEDIAASLLPFTIASGKDSVTVKTYSGKSSPAVLTGRMAINGFVHSTGSSTVLYDSTAATSVELVKDGWQDTDGTLYATNPGYLRIDTGRLAFIRFRIQELTNFTSFASMNVRLQSFYAHVTNEVGAPAWYTYAAGKWDEPNPANADSLRAQFARANSDSAGPTTAYVNAGFFVDGADFVSAIPAGFDGDATLTVFMTEHDSGRFLAEGTESSTYVNRLIFSYNSGTTTTLPDSIYAKALARADSGITRLWRAGTLLTKKADGAVIGRGEWCWSSDGDSVYVDGTLAQMDSLEADMVGPLIVAAGDNFTAAKLIFRNSNKSGVRVTGADAIIANSLFDSSAVGGSAVGNGSQWANNIFSTVSDTALAVYGTGVTETTNAYVTGSNTTGLTSPLQLASYDPSDPQQALNGTGTDVGFGDDIGPVDVPDVSSAITTRRGYGGAGKWGSSYWQRWKGNPW